MNIKGIEQTVPKVDHVGRTQKIADEGASSERFVLQLNRQFRAERRSIKETQSGTGQEIKEQGQENKKNRQGQLMQKRKRTKSKKKDMSIFQGTRQGNALDIRT